MRIAIFIVLLSTIQIVKACDICGCTSQGNYLSILPDNRYHLIGLRTNYSRYHSTHPDESISGSDILFTSEIWGRYILKSKIMFTAILPFHILSRKEGSESINTSNIGDAMLMTHWIVLKSKKSNLNQNLIIGGGVKFPVGNSNLIKNQNTLPPGLQPGTGTFDFVANVNYLIRKNNWGATLDLSSRLNTENNKQYKFGNRLTSSIKILHWWNKTGYSLVPQLGVDIENGEVDTKKNIHVEFTGGNILWANAGINLFLNNNYSFGLNVQAPITQSLNQGQTRAYPRINAQFIYLFNN
jgi:hypothetical protein